MKVLLLLWLLPSLKNGL